MTYNDKLDADEQVSMEEKIAAAIFDAGALEPGAEYRSIHEEDYADLGRSILLMVLEKFRPDLFTCSRCDKPAILLGFDGTLSCGQGRGDGLEPHDNVGVLYSPIQSVECGAVSFRVKETIGEGVINVPAVRRVQVPKGSGD